MSMHLRSLPFTIFIFSAIACDEEEDPADSPPQAPSDLMAEELSGGAHLTWQDNSDNETEFMIMRKLEADADFTTVATVPFDTAQYHDAPLEPGVTYMYMVMAMNDFGESTSGEVGFALP